MQNRKLRALKSRLKAEDSSTSITCERKKGIIRPVSDPKVVNMCSMTRILISVATYRRELYIKRILIALLTPA